MLISMTGYGRAENKTALGSVLVEIQSQNRKFFESVILNLPETFFGFDIEIKKELKKVISRGHVVLKFHLTKGEVETGLPSTHFLLQLKEKWISIAKEVGFEESKIDLVFLLDRLKEGNLVEEPTLEKESLIQTLKEALVSIVKMKKEEGAAIAEDLTQRLNTISLWLQEINEMAKKEPSAYREKLERKIGEYFSASSEDQERIGKEVVLFADRVDITEELVRLESHIQQFIKMINSEETVLGKKLDFLSQEMFRETNTIASKSSFTEIVKTAVEIKSELEKIREQIQNVE